MADGRGLRIVVNPDSGSALAADPMPTLREQLPAAEIVELNGPSDCEELLLAPPTPSAVGVSGGDGTVSAVAAIAVQLGVPLAVVPGGTLNHFAADLGIDTVDAAVDAFRSGHQRAVDVAEIDEHLFLNNASIGAYPQLVDARERFEKRIGKWPALVVALVIVLRRGEPLQVDIDGRRRRLWFAFFGNCTYDQQGLVAPAGRSRLDDGLLDVRLVHADRKYARLRLIACAVLRRLDRCSVYEATTAARLTVRSHDGPVRFAADGETHDGAVAFEVRKRPSALSVYAVRGSGASGSMS